MISFHNIAKGSNHMVRFLHVATGTRVEFPAFITEFSDKINVSWGTEQIFGRMDPIKPYQGTTRSISLGFDVVAPSLEIARENMTNYSKLVQMMYPVYSEPLAGTNQRGRVIKAPPLIRLQFLNLIKNNSPESHEQGLLGCINGFNFNPDRNNAGFYSEKEELFAKVFNISFNFEPQHETPLGFEHDKFITPNFPYGRQDTQGGDSTTSTTNPDVAAKKESDILGG